MEYFVSSFMNQIINNVGNTISPERMSQSIAHNMANQHVSKSIFSNKSYKHITDLFPSTHKPCNGRAWYELHYLIFKKFGTISSTSPHYNTYQPLQQVRTGRGTHRPSPPNAPPTAQQSHQRSSLGRTEWHTPPSHCPAVPGGRYPGWAD